MKNLLVYAHAIISLLCVFSIQASGQTPYFLRYYGGQDINEQARSIQQLAGGSIYISGYLNASGNTDPAVLKLDNYGDSVWMKTYGDSTFDAALFLNHCGASDLIMTGERVNDLTGTDVIVLKIDSTGALLWESIIQTNKNESGSYIEQTQDGGFIVCGFQSDNFGFNDIFLAKLDSLGTVSWVNHYGGADNDYAHQVHELPDGSLILTGDTRSKGAGGYDVEILKLTSTGEVIWDYTYGDELQNGCQGIYIAANGDLISYGETETYQFSPFDFSIERISPDGISIWKRVFGGDESDAAFSLLEDSEGSFIFTGYSNSFNGGEPIDVIIAKTNASGELLWLNDYGGTGIDIGYGIIEMEDGFLVGATSFNEGSDDFCLLHVSVEGLLTTITDPQNSIKPHIELSVYPNPSSGKLSIRFTESVKNFHLEIFDVTGRRVFKSAYTGNKKETTIQFNERPGLYWLLIQSNSGNWHLPIELQ
ncbi:MAG: T9SS type A sorting domain-containing protein [Chitinophagales bacterium]